MIPPDRAELVCALNNTRLKYIQFEVLAILDEKYENPRHGHFKDWRIYFGITTRINFEFKQILIKIQ